ncbi:hypothetical protein EfaecalisJ13_19610, partial [Enterococcus faecalis]
KSRNRW